MSDPHLPVGSPPKEDPQRLVLRGKPRPVIRFRRGLIVGLTGAAAALIVSLSWFALQPTSLRKAASAVESEEPDGKAGASELSNLPSSYGDVPRLGPPLPGDLGRPILEREQSQGDLPAPNAVHRDFEPQRSPDADRQRIADQREAARTSPVIVELDSAKNGTQPETGEPKQAAAVDENPSAGTPAIPANQQHKIDFAKDRAESDVNLHELSHPTSAWILTAGTIIPASLITGLNSDLPGLVLAQVTENVLDSATGRTVLIPQGSRLIGRYDSAVAYGQRRALLVWTRIVLPDGSSVDLDNMPATDISGYSGLEDQVDSHIWQLLKGVMLSTLLGVGTQISFGSSESDLVRAIRESAQQNAAHAGDQITTRNLEVQPTIRVRPGWPVRAIVNKDLVLQPWRG
jgi:type IV secretion system protein TrbI